MKAKYSIIDIVYILLIKASCKKCTVHFTMGSKHTIQCTRLLTVTWHFSSSTNTWQLSHTIFIIRYVSLFLLGFPGGDTGKEPTCQCRRHKRLGFDPWVGKSPWRRAWQLTPVFLPGESHGQRSLAGYSPWSLKESDTTEQLSMHTATYQNLYFIFLNTQAVPNVT